MIEAAIGCGGNLGDPGRGIVRALTRLGGDAGIRLARVSSLYRSAPWGLTDQPDYLNAVALLETTLSADALLARLRAEEERAGRVRERRWGPRTLDLDLLWYGNELRDDPTLALPHPRLAERTFVLEPLAEIRPSWRHPRTGRTPAEMLEILRRSGRATLCEIAAPPPRIGAAPPTGEPAREEVAWRS